MMNEIDYLGTKCRVYRYCLNIMRMRLFHFWFGKTKYLKVDTISTRIKSMKYKIQCMSLLRRSS